MQIGKTKESIRRRSVLRQLHTGFKAHSAHLPGGHAGDFLAHGPEGGIRLAADVSSVEGWTFAPERAVYAAVNAFAVKGAVPLAAFVSVLMPEGTEEAALKELAGRLDELCGRENLCLSAVYTAVSPFVTDLVISVNAVGTAGPAQEGRELCRETGAGMDVVTAGTVGREGAAMMAIEGREFLLDRYAPSYLDEAACLFNDGVMRPAADLLRENGALLIHDLREGGVFAGLWEMAAAAKVGLDIDLRSIPVDQHTIEMCEYFNVNPYMLRSAGCLLAVCENGADAVRDLRKAGIPSAVVGKTTEENQRIIRYDDEVRFLEPPKPDEYYKVIKFLRDNGGYHA